MVEKASLEFRLRKIDEPRRHPLDEIKYNDLMKENYKKIFKYLNYVENLLILVSTITGCVSISIFASLVDINVVITSSSVGINICEIIVGIKKYKSMIKKKKKKPDKMALLGKDKLNTIEVLIFKSIIDPYISHNESVSVNNVLTEYNEMKIEIKKPWNFCGIHYIKMVDISRKRVKEMV